MLLATKIVLGSAAVATLAGSVLMPRGAGASDTSAAWPQAAAPSHPLRAAAALPGADGGAAAGHLLQLQLQGPVGCAGPCEFGSVVARIR